MRTCGRRGNRNSRLIYSRLHGPDHCDLEQRELDREGESSSLPDSGVSNKCGLRQRTKARMWKQLRRLRGDEAYVLRVAQKIEAKGGSLTDALGSVLVDCSQTMLVRTAAGDILAVGK